MRSVILLPMLALLACADDQPVASEPTPEETIAAAEADANQRADTIRASESLSAAQDFVEEIATDGTLEVGMAKIAAEQAEREEVRTFAESAIETNQRLLQGLQAAAERAGLTLDTVLTDEEERNFAQLRGARSIDDMYLERTRERYADMAEELADYAEEGEIADLRNWAGEAAAQLETHREALAEL